MLLHFNMLLDEAKIDPRDVRLLRHQAVGIGKVTPYLLWRDNEAEFERYQSAQVVERRAYFASKYWAGFVVPPDGGTLFVGLYEVDGHSPAPDDWIDPITDETVGRTGRNVDIYELRRLPEFDHLAGRVRIAWGDGARSWSQRASSDRGSKAITEYAPEFREPIFPGYMQFVGNLAGLASLPTSWAAALSVMGGVYLLTCPRTKEQYVGAAYGAGGFWGRWQSYIATGHGGNKGLISRNPSDYQISILEVAGSASSSADVMLMEQLWKLKLQSREMGLNRN